MNVGDLVYLDENGRLTTAQKAASPIGVVTAVRGHEADVLVHGNGATMKFDVTKRVGWGPDNLQLMEEALRETE